MARIIVTTRLSVYAHPLLVPPAGDGDGAALYLGLVVDRCGVGPSATLVEPAGSRVSDRDREPGGVEAARDLVLGMLHEEACNTGPASRGGYVDLLDLVFFDGH